MVPAAADQQCRQIIVQMAVPVGQAGTVDDHPVVEQAASPSLIDFSFPSHPATCLVWYSLIWMTLSISSCLPWWCVHGMVAVGDADLAIRAARALAGHEEGQDPGQIRLERDREHVAHQLEVLGEVGRHAGSGLSIPIDLDAFLLRPWRMGAVGCMAAKAPGRARRKGSNGRDGLASCMATTRRKRKPHGQRRVAQCERFNCFCGKQGRRSDVRDLRPGRISAIGPDRADRRSLYCS